MLVRTGLYFFVAPVLDPLKKLLLPQSLLSKLGQHVLNLIRKPSTIAPYKQNLNAI
jgi:hypothetical protein